MGTIDRTEHNFTCPKCKATESITVVEKGSGWRASWMPPPEATKFTVTWSKDGVGEPTAQSIVCNNCGTAAADEIL